MTTAQPTNLLLSTLPPSVRRKLLIQQEPVRLEPSTALVEQGENTRHVYFPIDSVISLLTAPSEENAALEVSVIGNEGMVGVWLLLGVDVAPLRALVQASGLAWRVDAKTFREMAANRNARDTLDRYLYVQLVQLAQTAACTRFHVVESRLARSLLMTRDRAHSREFHVTQELLAHGLGVRRAGVTRAATSLRQRKLIRYSRGAVEITDERGLERAACGCYAADKETYAGVIGRGRRS